MRFAAIINGLRLDEPTETWISALVMTLADVPVTPEARKICVFPSAESRKLAVLLPNGGKQTEEASIWVAFVLRHLAPEVTAQAVELARKMLVTYRERSNLAASPSELHPHAIKILVPPLLPVTARPEEWLAAILQAMPSDQRTSVCQLVNSGLRPETPGRYVLHADMGSLLS